MYIAIEGYSFCAACRKTFGFLLTPKNAAQTAVNKTVEKLIVLIIAFSTPTVLSLCAYYCLEAECMGEFDSEMNSLYPTLVIWIAGFFLADSIAGVFECTIDTIFLCSFKDAEEFDGKYMSDDMREAFGLDVAEAEATPIQTSGDYKAHHETAVKIKAEKVAAKKGEPQLEMTVAA